MLFDEALIECFDTILLYHIGFMRIFCFWQFKTFCYEDNEGVFFVFVFSNSTQILESVCLYQDTLNLRFVEGKHQGHRKAFTDFLKKHWLDFFGFC